MKPRAYLICEKLPVEISASTIFVSATKPAEKIAGGEQVRQEINLNLPQSGLAPAIVEQSP